MIRSRVRDEREERLAEEERDDREVVPDQPARGQPDSSPSRTVAGTTIDRDHELPASAGRTCRTEHRVDVRAEAEEGDVAEVEQPGAADDDVQPEREQHVDQRVEADPQDVVVAVDERQQRGGDDDQAEARPRRDPLRGGGDPRPRRAARGPRPLSCDAPPITTSGSGVGARSPGSDLPDVRLARAARSGGSASPDQDQRTPRAFWNVDPRRTRRERLGEPDREPAEHGPGEVADAADDGGGERLQPGLEAHVRVELLVDEPVNTPAAPASAEPMKNVAAITRLTSIPIISAASRSNEVGAHRAPELRVARRTA